MGADEPDDRVAHFPIRSVSSLFGWVGILARVWIVGQAQIGAQHIDAGLPVLLPVIGQPRHGVHAGQPDRWLDIAELGCDRGEPFVEDPGPVMSGVGLGDLLPPVGHDQRPGAGHRGKDQLQHPDCVLQCGCPVVAVSGRAQQHPRQPGQTGQTDYRRREAHGQGGAEAP